MRVACAWAKATMLSAWAVRLLGYARNIHAGFRVEPCLLINRLLKGTSGHCTGYRARRNRKRDDSEQVEEAILVPDRVASQCRQQPKRGHSAEDDRELKHWQSLSCALKYPTDSASRHLQRIFRRQRFDSRNHGQYHGLCGSQAIRRMDEPPRTAISLPKWWQIARRNNPLSFSK